MLEPDRGLLPMVILISWLVVVVAFVVIAGLVLAWVRRTGGLR